MLDDDTADAALSALTASYGRGLPRKLADVEDAIARARAHPMDDAAWSSARLLAHRLAGTAGSYGFLDVTRALVRVEAALDAPATPSSGAIVDDAIRESRVCCSRATSAFPTTLGRATGPQTHPVVELADLLFLAVLRRGYTHVIVEPVGAAYRVVADEGTVGEASMEVGRDTGEGLAARIAILAGLDVAAPEDRIGRLTLAIAAPETAATPLDRRLSILTPTVTIARPIRAELMVVARSSDGLALELRRVAALGLTTATHDRGSDASKGAPPWPLPARSSPYRLVRELGRGGMGVVYLAEHEVLEKQVALKVLHAEVASHTATAAALVREGRAASRARHPGVLDVTDFGVLPDGRAYLVMELIGAPTLGRMLKDGPLAPLRAVRILRALADAVDAVHDAGVVHGDLKPSNVFVLEDDRIKLSDFGTASFERAHGGPALPPPLALTPSYAAPEAGEGIMADRRFDVYALGCVLFEAVTGRVPYRGESALGTLRMHRTSPVPKAAEIPPFLAEVIERALAKEPAVRYQTAGAMVEDLDRAIAILTAVAAPAPSASTAGRAGAPEERT